jgi:uncharacterized protein (TIGR00290 family)
MRVAVTWTGGKDCCLALYDVFSQGHEVSTLINFIFTDTEKRTPYKFSNLLSFILKDFGKFSPYKASILLRYLLETASKNTPKKISTKTHYILEAASKNTPKKISTLISYILRGSESMIWHEVSPEIIAIQSKAIDIPIIQRKTTWRTFEDQFKEVMNELKHEGIEGAVWGIAPPGYLTMDNYEKFKDYMQLMAERDWIYKVCEELKIEPFLPLWEKSPEQVLVELIEKGFEVVIVVVNPKILPEKWLGRKVNLDFVEDIRKLHRSKGIHVGGDEYHTFVIDGPIFKKRLEIVKSKKMSKGDYLILNISEVRPVDK